MPDSRTPWSRRRFIAGGLALTAALRLPRPARADAVAPACTLAPEQEVGPFYLADELVRADISEGKPGIPLTVRLAVLDARTCQPLQGAAVDLWHCDAQGLYSGFTKSTLGGPGGPGFPGGLGLRGAPPPGFPPPHPGDGRPPGPPGDFRGPPPAAKPTDHLTFLRGIQLTDKDGAVVFNTVFPGFYMGRVNHIHFKIRIGGAASGHTYQAGHTSHVGQLFFPESQTAALMQQEPYKSHAIHRTTADEDGIFQDQHGALFIAELLPAREGKPEQGLRAGLSVSVDPNASPQPVGMGPRPPPTSP